MKRTKKITLSALFCALSVVILLVASFLQIADIAVSMVASALVMLALIEMGQSFALMIYFATSFLTLAFLPNKFIAAVYFAFSGLYPILKRFFDARGKILSLILKAIYFNGVLAATLLVSKYLFPLEIESENYTFFFIASYFVIANIAFWLFDILLHRVTLLYLTRYRHKTRRFFK